MQKRESLLSWEIRLDSSAILHYNFQFNKRLAIRINGTIRIQYTTDKVYK